MSDTYTESENSFLRSALMVMMQRLNADTLNFKHDDLQGVPDNKELHIIYDADMGRTKVAMLDKRKANGKEILDTEHEQARMAGFTGDVCDMCGSSMMVRNGNCLCCKACGASSGCG